jgi:hypothetical protein
MGAAGDAAVDEPWSLGDRVGTGLAPGRVTSMVRD